MNSAACPAGNDFDCSVMSATVTVFDLEFTAWEGSVARRWLGPGEFKEIVQIGAVRLDARTLDEQAALNLIVKPRINPVLSDYLENLTGVTNERLSAEGIEFAEAWRRFIEFAGSGPICAFGRDDLVFRENLRLLGLEETPKLPPYTSANSVLRANGIDPEGRRACHVAPLCGVAFVGHEHDGLDDARGVAAGFRALIGRGAANPFLDHEVWTAAGGSGLQQP